MTNLKFIKDIGLENPQIISYVLVSLILFCSVEGVLEFTKTENQSWQSKIQLLTLIAIPICSIILAYPKIFLSSVLSGTSRLDLVIPLISSIIVAFLASILNFGIVSNLVFFKLRKTLLPGQIFGMLLLPLLIVIFIYSINLINNDSNLVVLILRNLYFIIFFTISFFIWSPKEKIFSKENLDSLAKKSDSLDRQVETYEYVKSLRNPLSTPRNKIHKQIMKIIKNGDEEKKKSIFPRFIMLKELSFKEEGAHLIPSNDEIQDNDLVLRVNFIQKSDGKIIQTEDVKYKYVKQACKEVSKVSAGNDIRSFLTPMSTRAYDLQSFHEHDQNELMLKLSMGDENISQLKELFKKRNPDVNYLASNGWSALLIAVANGQEDTAKYLLQKAADPSVSTKHGASPLHFASKYGKLSLCKLLIKYQANINQIDIDGSTPLMIAARYGHGSIVQYLIENNADVNLTNYKKKTSIDFATEGNFGEICRILKKDIP